MEALTITCKHLSLDRNEIILKLRRQKHAATQANYRLRQKLRELELTNRLMIVTYLAGAAHTRILEEQLQRRVMSEIDEFSH